MQKLYFDKTARTLACRNLAGATSDMQRVRLKGNRRRRLFHYEASRLQSFPGCLNSREMKRSKFNQTGNAVPPLLAFQPANAA
jgi:DNA (cytosine-5)-methyltransferase 1